MSLSFVARSVYTSCGKKCIQEVYTSYPTRVHSHVCVYFPRCVSVYRPVTNKAMIIDSTSLECQELGLRILFSFNPHSLIQQRLNVYYV